MIPSRRALLGAAHGQDQPTVARERREQRLGDLGGSRSHQDRLEGPTLAAAHQPVPADRPGAKAQRGQAPRLGQGWITGHQKSSAVPRKKTCSVWCQPRDESANS